MFSSTCSGCAGATSLLQVASGCVPSSLPTSFTSAGKERHCVQQTSGKEGTSKTLGSKNLTLLFSFCTLLMVVEWGALKVLVGLI